MIKLLLILWLLLIHSIAVLALLETDLAYRIDRKLGIGIITSKEITPFYNDMIGSHQQLDGSVVDGSVIFLGDSITQGLNTSAITHPTVNYGIGMDTTYGLIKRVPDYASLTRASHIVIAIGVNDLIRTHRENDAILANFERLFQLLPTDKLTTLQAILPVDERVTTKGFNKRVDALNARLKTLTESKGAHFINMASKLTDEQGNLKTEFHIGDGLHLSTEAYQVWIDVLKQHLDAQ